MDLERRSKNKPFNGEEDFGGPRFGGLCCGGFRGEKGLFICAELNDTVSHPVWNLSCFTSLHTSQSLSFPLLPPNTLVLLFWQLSCFEDIQVKCRIITIAVIKANASAKRGDASALYVCNPIKCYIYYDIKPLRLEQPELKSCRENKLDV